MKKITNLFVILFMLITLIISGCSSDKPNFRNGQNRMQDLTEEERQQMFEGRSRIENLSEEERKEMFEERQQLAIESCKEKNEGDSCTLKSPRGEIEGICKIIDENLVCTMDRPEGPIRQRIE